MDITNDQPERIGEQHLIGNLVAETVDDVCGPAFALLFLLIAGRAEDLLELDMGAIGCLPEVLKDYGLDLDIDVQSTGIEEEGFERLRLRDAQERSALQVIREEVQRLC